jgi:hypothetical protein
MALISHTYFLILDSEKEDTQILSNVENTLNSGMEVCHFIL